MTTGRLHELTLEKCGLSQDKRFLVVHETSQECLKELKWAQPEINGSTRQQAG